MKILAMLTFVIVLQVGCSGDSASKTTDDSRSKTTGSPTSSRSDSRSRVPVARVATREEAILALKNLGGIVSLGDDMDGEADGFVSLNNKKITDSDLVYLKGFTRLTTLELGGTKITDVGLVHLKGLTELTNLNLNKTNVSDAGLVHLKGLTKLQTVNLFFTKVTPAGVKMLEAALPKCKVFYPR